MELLLKDIGMKKFVVSQASLYKGKVVYATGILAQDDIGYVRDQHLKQVIVEDSIGGMNFVESYPFDINQGFYVMKMSIEDYLNWFKEKRGRK
jgi:pimeloyl-CoA synthetase